jgi:Leucine Rich repeats (2 copies)/Divergent InlB B-repeat domain
MNEHNTALRRIVRSTRCRPRVVVASTALLCGLAAHAAIPGSERTALIDFYNSTNGASWTNNTGWMGAAGTECAWAGVECNTAGTTVIVLNRSGGGLSGTLPASINQLTNLRYLYVASNKITGSTPVLTGMNSLETAELSNNLLNGSLANFSGLPSLKRFGAGNNRLTGSIPALTSLPQLQNLNLSDNRLSGTIPSLASLTALTELYLHRNALTGSVPSFSGLSNLSEVFLQSNRLTGTLPSLASVSNLTGFRVENNQITGTAPTPPATNSLTANSSQLCPNPMTHTDSSVWDLATNSSPWSTACTSSFVVTPVPTAGGSIFPDWPQLAGGVTPYVQFNVVPDAGYGVIVRGTCRAGTLSGTLYRVSNIPADCTVAPEFSNAMFTVTVTSTTGGTVSPLGAQTVRFGSQLTVTSVPDAGYRVSNISTNCGNGYFGSGTSIMTQQIEANCMVSITFAPLAVNVTATATVSVPSGGIAGGVVSPASRTVAQGQSTTFALIPDVGYRSSSASGCGATLTGNIATTGALTVNCTINVAFVKTCALDVNRDLSTTAATDGALILRYLLGFRGSALVDGIAGVNPANAAAIATYIAEHLYLGVETVKPTAAVTGLILYRLMTGVGDSALLTGIQRPAGSPLPSAAAIRADVNRECLTQY